MIDSICPRCKKSFTRAGCKPGRYCSKQCYSLADVPALLADAAQLQAAYAEKTAAEIGASIGRDRKVVEKWLKRHGIPRRRRGTSANCRRIRKGDPNPMQGRKHSPETRKLLSDMAKASGRLPYKVENGPPWKGKGGPLHPNWKGGKTPERNAFYATDEWKAAVYHVLKRDEHKCQRCGLVKVPCGEVSFDIHHVVSFAYKPLRCELTNLVLLCEPCHYWTHSSDNVEKVFIKDVPVPVSEL